VLLLLGDGTSLQATELPGRGPWTFLLLTSAPEVPEAPGVREGRDVREGPGVAGAPEIRGAAGVPEGPGVAEAPGPSSGSGPGVPAGADPEPAGPGDGGVAWFLTRFGRVVVPDLRGRPGWGGPAEAPGHLDLVDDLDQVRTRAGLGRPVLVGVGGLAPLALRAAADQPWAWRALILAPPAGGPAVTADLDQLGLPVLVLAAGPPPTEQAEAVERLLGRLGRGPGWSGIAPDAPPR
jgi:pimeloyl-ACP methyl ester carboxylesterase